MSSEQDWKTIFGVLERPQSLGDAPQVKQTVTSGLLFQILRAGGKGDPATASTLELDGTAIGSLMASGTTSAFTNMPHLREVSLSRCSLSAAAVSAIDTAVLAPLKFLQELRIDCNDLPMLPRLNHAALCVLSASDNCIAAIEGPSSLPSLTSLDASGNSGFPLEVAFDRTKLHCPGLTVLDLARCNLTSLKGLNHLPKLKSVTVSGNRLRSLQGLERLTHLESVDASSNDIADATALEGSAAVLTQLDLQDNRITADAAFPAAASASTFPKVWCLRLSGNPIASDRLLCRLTERFPNLECFELEGVKVADTSRVLRALGTLKNLRELRLDLEPTTTPGQVVEAVPTLEEWNGAETAGGAPRTGGALGLGDLSDLESMLDPATLRALRDISVDVKLAASAEGGSAVVPRPGSAAGRPGSASGMRPGSASGRPISAAGRIGKRGAVMDNDVLDTADVFREELQVSGAHALALVQSIETRTRELFGAPPTPPDAAAAATEEGATAAEIQEAPGRGNTRRPSVDSSLSMGTPDRSGATPLLHQPSPPRPLEAVVRGADNSRRGSSGQSTQQPRGRSSSSRPVPRSASMSAPTNVATPALQERPASEGHAASASSKALALRGVVASAKEVQRRIEQSADEQHRARIMALPAGRNSSLVRSGTLPLSTPTSSSSAPGSSAAPAKKKAVDAVTSTTTTTFAGRASGISHAAPSGPVVRHSMAVGTDVTIPPAPSTAPSGKPVPGFVSSASSGAAWGPTRVTGPRVGDAHDPSGRSDDDDVEDDDGDGDADAIALILRGDDPRGASQSQSQHPSIGSPLDSAQAVTESLRPCSATLRHTTSSSASGIPTTTTTTGAPVNGARPTGLAGLAAKKRQDRDDRIAAERLVEARTGKPASITAGVAGGSGAPTSLNVRRRAM